MNVKKYIYYSALIGKSLTSTFEFLLGGYMIIFGYDKIQSFLSFFANSELNEDKTDFLAIKIISFSQHIGEKGSTLLAWYLLIEGLMKLIILYGILREKKKIFPFAIGIFSIIVGYEAYLLITRPSTSILLLLIFDGLLLGMIVHKYQSFSKKD